MLEFLNNKLLCPPLDAETMAAMPKVDESIFEDLPEKPSESQMQDVIVRDSLMLSVNATNERNTPLPDQGNQWCPLHGGLPII